MTRHLAVLAFYAALSMAAPPSSAERVNLEQEKNGPFEKPLPYPSEVISKKDSLLVRATAREPFMLRGREVEAPLKIASYFLARPWLAYRLAEELQGSPFSFSLDKEEGEWEMSTIGRRYDLTPLSDGKKMKILKFIFLFRFPLGIGIKTSGGGFIVIRTRPADDNGGTLIDYDIYLVTGSLPIDKLTKPFPFIQGGLMQADFESVLSPFAQLCELVADDPESVAEEMEAADETFSEGEVEEFKRLFVKK